MTPPPLGRGNNSPYPYGEGRGGWWTVGMLKMCRLNDRFSTRAQVDEIRKSFKYFFLSCFKCPVQNVATTFCFQNNQLKIITADMLPISIVEAKGFRDLIAFLEPDYNAMSPNYDGENVQRSSRLAL